MHEYTFLLFFIKYCFCLLFCDKFYISNIFFYLKFLRGIYWKEIVMKFKLLCIVLMFFSIKDTISLVHPDGSMCASSGRWDNDQCVYSLF